MDSKNKFIGILVTLLLVLLIVVGLVILNYDKLKEANGIEDIEYIEVDIKDSTEEDIVVGVGEKRNMYLFWGDGCIHCHNLKIFLNDLEQEYKDMFELYAFEVWENPDNKTLMNTFAEKLGDNITGVPYLVIGKKSFNGYKKSYEEEIKKAIKEEYYSEEKYDVYEELNK